MALKATIFKAELQVSDLDRHYFATHSLTIARHPSETDQRMMVRLVAFALNADERLEFGRGLSSEDEADLVRKDLTGTIELWIEVGLPDEREIRKAAGRARAVAVYLYGGRSAALWWRQNEAAMAKLDNVTVVEIPEDASAQLASLAQRNMRCDCTVQEGQVYLHAGDAALQFEPVVLKAATRA
ncbi:MAG: YaeQ family protein [Burkholderiales bacterium]|nr:YaeQ family protein [Burkholderiales bacterium]